MGTDLTNGQARSGRVRAPCDLEAHQGSPGRSESKGKTLGNHERIAKAKQDTTKARAETVRRAITSTLHLSATAPPAEWVH